jgi:hypothetical protein
MKGWLLTDILHSRTTPEEAFKGRPSPRNTTGRALSCPDQHPGQPESSDMFTTLQPPTEQELDSRSRHPHGAAGLSQYISRYSAGKLMDIYVQYVSELMVICFGGPHC